MTFGNGLSSWRTASPKQDWRTKRAQKKQADIEPVLGPMRMALVDNWTPTTCRLVCGGAIGTGFIEAVWKQLKDTRSRVILKPVTGNKPGDTIDHDGTCVLSWDEDGGNGKVDDDEVLRLVVAEARRRTR